MCYTPWNCPICYGKGFGPRCEHKPGCHYKPEPTFLERYNAAKTPWAKVSVMEGEWNDQAMFPEIGRAAVTVREVTSWARRYCTGLISFQDFAAALPVYLDPQETLMQYIDDEEARFERLRAEGHKLMQAALPPGIKVTVGVPAAAPPSVFMPTLPQDLLKPINMTVKVFKVFKNGCCHECSNEIVPALDAYYGKDPRGKDHCAPCRREMRIE